MPAGVFKREVDLSLYIEVASNLKLGLVGPFSKGPFERTLISNNSALESTFGKPIDSSSLSQPFFGAQRYLKYGNQAYIMRVESSTTPAVTSKTALRGGTDDSIATAADGSTSIPSTRELTSVTGDFVNDGVLAGDTLEIHEGSGDDGFYVIDTVAATVLTVDRDFPTGSLSSLDFTVWTSKREAGVDGATGPQAGRTFTSATSTFQTNGVAAGDVLYINDTGDSEDNGFYTILSVTSETALVVNRKWREGDLTGLTFTIYGPNHPAAADGDTSTDGEFVSSSAKFADHNVQAGDLLIIEDANDTEDNGVYVITGLKTGATDTTLEVNVSAWQASNTGLSFRVVPAPITLDGATKGTWLDGSYAITRSNTNSGTDFDLEIVDSDGHSLETIFNLDTANADSEVDSNSGYVVAAVTSNRIGPAIEYTGTFNGGGNGTTGLTDADILGNTALKTGLEAFRNIEEVEIDVLLVPGYTTQNIGDGLLSMAATTRGDCMCIIDPPDSPTITSPQGVIDWANGTGGYGRTAALNSSYAAVYWPWIKMYDAFNDTDRWTAPSGHAAGVWANSENITYPWFAPAGTKRGLIQGVLDIRLSPDGGQQQAMQDSGNINPIVKFLREGVTVYGQKTMLRSTSALNRINVRRMLLYAERASLAAVKPLTFDPNDTATDREVVRLLTPLFQFIEDNRGLRDYLVLADDSTSPPAVRAANKLISKIFIKPTTTAEIIELNFILTAQSADFDELVAA